MFLSRPLAFTVTALLFGAGAAVGVIGLRAQERENVADKPAVRRPVETPALSPSPMIPEPPATAPESATGSSRAPESAGSTPKPPGMAAGAPSSADAQGELDPEAQFAAERAARMNQLVPIGRIFRGVKIPNYSGDTLGSVVNADFMRRADDEHLEMEMLEIVNYNRGVPDSRMLTDRAIYDIEAKTLRSTTPAKIIQQQFEMTGDRMIFDSNTRIGHMSGRVKTRIYQVDQYSSGQ